MLKQIKNNELVKTFRALEGNPKWSIMTEPLWFVPFSLYSPFASVYMYALGLTELEIGLVLSVGMILQVFFALISGVVTDKIGRRKATFYFDTIGWSIPCLLWAFSQNIWWFLLAAGFNAVFQITNTSWTCLFSEDCPEKHLVNAFTLIQFAGMLSVFIAPLSIVLIDHYSLIPVVRGLYFMSAISMTIKFVLLYIYGGETRQGKIRMEETKNTPWFDLLKGYKEVLVQILSSRKMMLVLIFMGLVNTSTIATTNFFALYITNHLGLSDGFVAVFPIIRTVVMMLFVICMQGVLNRLSIRHSVVIGFGFHICAHILLIVAPVESIEMVIGYTLLEAVGYSIVMPRKDALMTQFVDPKERSRIYALLHMAMIAISAPFGSIIGYLSEVNGIYPFLFNIILFMLGSIIIYRSRSLIELER